MSTYAIDSVTGSYPSTKAPGSILGSGRSQELSVAVSDELGRLDSPYAKHRIFANDLILGGILGRRIFGGTYWFSSVATTDQAIDVAPSSLPGAVADVRSWLKMPIDDVAQLFGVKRRHLYYVLNDDRDVSLEKGRRIRLVHKLFADINAALEGSDRSLRDAVLMPLNDDYQSLFDIAKDGDEEAITAGARKLLSRIAGGDMSNETTRPAPYTPLLSEEEIVLALKARR